jgi:hypothetical protein
MARTLEFLISIQDPDGSFYETRQKLAHSPQSWLQKETLKDRFYFTAAVPMRLFPLGYRIHPVIDPAMRWLGRHVADWRLVTATCYNLWALLCIDPEGSRFGTSLFRRCSETAADWLIKLEAQPLTWLLDALKSAGYPAEQPLVAMGMKRLLALQDENGIWPSAHGATAETTVTAIRIIHGNGATSAPGE